MPYLVEAWRDALRYTKAGVTQVMLGMGQRGRPFFRDFHNWRSMATFMLFFGDPCDYEPTELVGSRCFSLDFFKKRPGGNLMQKPRRKPWATRQRGTLQPLDGQREWFHEYCSLCYRDVDRNDICKPNTFFEYMVSIRWSSPFPPNGTWPFCRTWCCRLVRLSTRLLLPLETQSPRVWCQNLKLLLLYSSLGEAVNTPKSTWCCKWLRSNCLHTWHSMASNSEFKWRYCMEEIRRTSWGW